MAEFPEEVKEGLKILAEHLRDLGVGLEITVAPFNDVSNTHFLNRHVTESHKLRLSFSGAESVTIAAWEVVSHGSYRPPGVWESVEDMRVSRGPDWFATALMTAFGVPDVPPPVVPEPEYKSVPNDSPDATWAVWIKTGDHGIYPESCYDSKEAAFWTVMRFRMRAESRGDLWAWVMMPRRTVPLTPAALNVLAMALGVNEDPEACLFLTKADLERWIHPREHRVDGW